MKESTIMKIHYGTALASVGLVAVHILMRLTTGFADSLSYENVLANYRSVPYVIMLELILILLAVHGFNGLRVILLELKQGRVYEKGRFIWLCSGNDCINWIWLKNNYYDKYGDG